MKHLIAVAYPDEGRAAEVLDTLRRLQRDDLIDLEHAVYVTRGRDGRAQLHQGVSNVGAGAASGGLAGLLVGLLLVLPLAGAAVGAAGGALGGKVVDLGLEHGFVRRLTEELPAGSSALFVLVRQGVPEAIIPAVSAFGGTLLETTLPDDAEARLQAALDAGDPR